MNPHKGILIDPFACTVTEVDFPDTDYRRLYPLLSHESMPVDCFEAVHVRGLNSRDVLYVDESGRLKPCDRYFVIQGFPEPLCGKGLILGCNAAGDSVSPKTPLLVVCASVRFLECDDRKWRTATKPWAPPTRQ